MDRQGRLTIPQELKDYAGIEKDLITVGSNKTIEIWSREQWSDGVDPETEEVMNASEVAEAWNSMDFKHVPVLYEECMANLCIKPDGVYVDGTLGGGGHALGIGKRLAPSGTLIGIDRDADAISAASERLKGLECRTLFVHDRYSNIKSILSDLGTDGIDGALLDIGVSSFQLDNSDRGFSYMHDAPLDMRMDRSDEFSAYELVNGYSREQLTEVIRKYGEEKWASRISDFIVRERAKGEIKTTGELVDIIKAAIPASARRSGRHPGKENVPRP